MTARERETMKDAESALYLRHPLAFIWRQNSGRKGYVRFASVNLPDYVGVAHDGRAIFCEVKRENTRLTTEQYEFLSRMANMDAWSYVWTPAGLYQLDEMPAKHMPREGRSRADGHHHRGRRVRGREMKRKQKQEKAMQRFQARQGDVFIQRLPDDAEFPANVTEVKPDARRTVLAYGEVTGHAHALPSRAKLFRMDTEPNSGGLAPSSYLVIEGLPASLKHEEHAPINLPAGKYKITIQREYHPAELRNVAD